MGKLLSGIAAGTIVGAAVGMAIVPNLDRKTQKKIRRICKKASCMAEDRCGDMLSKFR